MNRRNTIIIAVLVNAGLLLILFATAMRSGDKKEDTCVKLAEAPLAPKEATSTPVTTEELLNEYIAASSNAEPEEVIVLDDLVNGTSVIPSTDLSSPPVAQAPSSSLPAIQPHPSVNPSPQATEPKPSAPKAPQNVATAPKSTPPVKEAVSEVIVKKGDYLEKIAKAHNTSVNAIMQANHLSSTNLKVGQVLKIPGKAKLENSDSLQNKDFYIVKEGDSPWLIASKCNVKLDELLRINNIDEHKAKRLRPGDKLRIR